MVHHCGRWARPSFDGNRGEMVISSGVHSMLTKRSNGNGGAKRKAKPKEDWLEADSIELVPQDRIPLCEK
jgi:hypothetical protein